ncbi:MAG: hypothetical protein H6822_02425 [Planctomycetaceae bacterium]|nr:hypothetical protein [Planctomycetales bacterium]MCB9921006.1 hypothetical protein [Planctomycetaceae bacterium]
MKRSVLLTTTVLLIACIGCHKASEPQSKASKVEPAEKVTATKPDWKLVTLHIEGFKKSKSGGT